MAEPGDTLRRIADRGEPRGATAVWTGAERRLGARVRRRRARAIGAAALLVVVAVTAAVVWRQDADRGAVEVVGPAEPTTTPPSEPGCCPLPSTMVAAVEVDESLHEVVLVDVTTGDVVRVLYEEETGLPEAEAEAAVSSIASVDLAPGGASVAVDICCEPAAGRMLEVPIEGGEAVLCCDASAPAYSPDGTRLAGISLQWLMVFDRKSRRARHFFPAADGSPPCAAAAPTWAPDGSKVAFVAIDDCDSGSWSLRILDLATADDLDDAQVVQPPEGSDYWAPAFRADGRLVVAVQTPGEHVFDFTASRGAVVDPGSGREVEAFEYRGVVSTQRYDASGTNLLVTYEGGRVEWVSGDRTGTVPGSYLDAAWR